MSPTVQIILLWLGFAGSHLALSSAPLRSRVIARIGEKPFRGLYSLVAFAFFIPLVHIYFGHKHAGAWLWNLPHNATLLWAVYCGMALAFVLMVAGLVTPSPGFIVPGKPTPRGVHLITRHPLMMGIALLGLVHLLPNGTTADVAFFGGLVLFALVGSAHQDRRMLASRPGFREFYDSTPFIPFTGPNGLRGVRELIPTVAGLGILTAIAVRYFHGSLFGG